MANNYLQFSLNVPLKSKEEQTWCEATLAAFVNLLEDADQKAPAQLGTLGQRAVYEQWDYLCFEWSLSDGNLWLYAEESGSPEQVAAFLELYLSTFNPAGAITFSWAHTCSKMRADQFGGGAAVIRATGSKFIDAQSWAEEQAAAPT